MYEFEFHRPPAIDEAIRLLESDDDALVLAGGQSLLPMMKLRLAQASKLVDLSAIPALVGIDRGSQGITIKAMTTHIQVASNNLVAEAIPALAQLASGIGDPLVRARGTIGGSIANNDPAADYPAACLALNATIATLTRAIPADDFFISPFTTAMESGEIVSQVTFPIPDAAGYAKFRHPASRFALAGVFVARFGTDIRVAVTGASQSGVFRWTDAESALRDSFAATSLDGLSPDEFEMSNDIHADASYRANLVRVMAQRAVRAAGPPSAG